MCFPSNKSTAVQNVLITGYKPKSFQCILWRSPLSVDRMRLHKNAVNPYIRANMRFETREQYSHQENDEKHFWTK